MISDFKATKSSKINKNNFKKLILKFSIKKLDTKKNFETSEIVNKFLFMTNVFIYN